MYMYTYDNCGFGPCGHIRSKFIVIRHHALHTSPCDLYCHFCVTGLWNKYSVNFEYQTSTGTSREIQSWKLLVFSCLRCLDKYKTIVFFTLIWSSLIILSIICKQNTQTIDCCKKSFFHQKNNYCIGYHHILHLNCVALPASNYLVNADCKIF